MQSGVRACSEARLCGRVPAIAAPYWRKIRRGQPESKVQAANINETVDRRSCLLSLSVGSLGLMMMTPLDTAAQGAGPLDKPLQGPQFYKTESGIKVQELTPGEGDNPKAGDKVLIDYVLRRANGYFIYATVEGVSFQPSDVPVGPIALTIPGSPEAGPMIPGLAEILMRMRQGGKLRAYIPPELGWKDCKTMEPQPPTFATKRQLCNHNREPLLMEIALRRVLR
ncbi:hypothetical protein DUNSADRAFT_18721 [Dunaliella salina]|uniref:peptidylprolyl isomerase n=1 Tax=Dunaliella salina TaxID=3046 RepID=A0ABQ7GYP5_DUNSA|nr:hypothetical protein DUNSADRAFT_18721 [Dunaliella salina]|eukprot:KAF5839721.1 hypothetical protein DUNSADRAFT_18721 [Dunaliella salina]